jgi:hypothetical protein
MRRAGLLAVMIVALCLAATAPALAVTGLAGRVTAIANGGGIAGAVVSYGTHKATSSATGWYTLALPAGSPTAS